MKVTAVGWRVFDVDLDGALGAPFTRRYWPAWVAAARPWSVDMTSASCPVAGQDASAEGAR
jgi:hypothetical protein